MSGTLGSLMERNLLEVFGQRDSARRTAAIAELYTEECTFFEAEEQSTRGKRSTRKSGVF
jgi:ketosteroid isomerase-like protein